MHRQSLGSPASNQHHSAAAISPSEAEEVKPQKKAAYRSSDERLIHLIPLLAIFCFLILYLSSHRPSQFEMAEFNKKLHNHGIDKMEPLLEISKGNILEMRSLRNLQEINKDEGRLHRKIGDF